ncbi:MAG: ABC transporter ATP-binding protein, partial [Oscillospiraceae bacterium]|nr:ABC transporter ATP-binding protein [Oscillospiraceae bacterium]
MIGIFRKFFRFCGTQKRLFYQSLFLSLLHAIFEAIRIPAIAIVLSAMINSTMSAGTVWASLIIMLISIVGCICTRASSTMKQTVGGYTVATNKRVEIGERLKYMPMGYFNDNSLGDITSVTTNTAENLQDVATRVIMLTTQGLLTTFIMILVILIYDWRIGVLLLIGVALFLAINSLMQKKSNKLSPQKNKSDIKLVSAVLEYIQGISVIRSYNMDRQANQTVDRAIAENEAINFKMEKSFVPYMCSQSIVLKLFTVLMVFLSVCFYLGGTLPLLNCLLLVVASFLVYAQLDSAGSYSALLRTLDISMDRINTIFETPIMDGDGRKITPPARDIVGKDFLFHYQS